MAKFRIHLLVFGIFLCALGFPGCSSNSITITLSPATTVTINAGQSQNITATLANDKNNQGVTWSLSGFGSLTNQTTTAVTYVAPVNISTESLATVTATSVANTTVTAVLSITVNPVLAIATTSLPVGTLRVPYVGVIGAVGAEGTFTWALTSGTLPAGLSLSSSSGTSVTILGTPVALGTSTFTIRVTDSNGVSASQTLGITINPPPPLSVATQSLPQGTVGTQYDATLLPANGTAPYSWTLTSGNLPPGNPAFALSPSGVITGTPTTAGSFPPFTVTVTDSSTPKPQTASATLSITINPSTAGNSRLNGNYAFLVSGFDGSNNFAAAGSFFADGNGNISSGLMDSNTPGAVQLSQTFTGSYAIGSNGLGTMLLNITAGGSRTFALAMMADGNADIIEFDDTTGTGTRNSGVLLKQTTSAFATSAIQGNYAFGFLGVDAQSNRYGFGGTFTADGNGHFNSGFLDSDDSATGALGPLAFTGTYNVQTTPANGRGTATISIAGKGTTNYSFYIVSATQLLVMEIDNVVGQSSPLVSGSILQQSSSGFTNASLNGTSVLETSALTSLSQTQAQVGLLTTNGGGGLSMSSDVNTAGSPSQNNSTIGATYSVSSAPNGRVTFSPSGSSGIASSNPVLYLVSTNQAFIVGTDSAVTFGFMESQSNPGSYGVASLDGTYAGGSTSPVQSSASDQVDIGVADGTGNVDFTTNASTSAGLLLNQTSSASYALLSSGRGTSAASIIYMVSPARFYEMHSDSGAMIEIFQQ